MDKDELARIQKGVYGKVKTTPFGKLMPSTDACYTWFSEGEAEMDFVIQRDGKIIPIEVKSADNSKAKSLSIYIGKFKPEYAIKISANNTLALPTVKRQSSFWHLKGKARIS
ncbi:MAG: DUF4143 domain-containing protein [Firmicutes bacterium]|nr:DUF4143 domain-containing protein [Bacillota bacterium]